MPFCIQCGTQNPDGYLFCANCGAKLVTPVYGAKPEPAPVVTAPEEPLRQVPPDTEKTVCSPAPQTGAGEPVQPYIPVSQMSGARYPEDSYIPASQYPEPSGIPAQQYAPGQTPAARRPEAPAAEPAEKKPRNGKVIALICAGVAVLLLLAGLVLLLVLPKDGEKTAEKDTPERTEAAETEKISGKPAPEQTSAAPETASQPLPAATEALPADPGTAPETEPPAAEPAEDPGTIHIAPPETAPPVTEVPEAPPVPEETEPSAAEAPDYGDPVGLWYTDTEDHYRVYFELFPDGTARQCYTQSNYIGNAIPYTWYAENGNLIITDAYGGQTAASYSVQNGILYVTREDGWDVVLYASSGEFPVPEAETWFEFVQLDCTWDEARAICNAMGGHLATVTSEEEEKRLIQAAQDAGFNYIWLGGYVENGRLYWVTGEDASYFDFSPNQPSGTDSDGVTPERELVLWYVEKYADHGAVGGWGWNDVNVDAVLDYYTGREIIAFACEMGDGLKDVAEYSN